MKRSSFIKSIVGIIVSPFILSAKSKEQKYGPIVNIPGDASKLKVTDDGFKWEMPIDPPYIPKSHDIVIRYDHKQKNLEWLKNEQYHVRSFENGRVYLETVTADPRKMRKFDLSLEEVQNDYRLLYHTIER